MSDRAGRRRRHKRHKRRARIGPGFGSGVRSEYFESATMTEACLRYEERALYPSFQRWHFAKFRVWPTSVMHILFEKIGGRSNRFDDLAWNTLGQKVATTETFDATRHGVERQFFVDLFFQMEKDKK